MKKDRKTMAANLRMKAEEHLVNKHPGSGQALTETDMLRLIHELEVHRIELELQNEELLSAKEAAELAEQKYFELYDLSPAGYFTLGNDGSILELNPAGAKILGKEKKDLIGSTFAFFISMDARIAFAEFLDKVFRSKSVETCEIKLESNDALKYARLVGRVSSKSEQCLVAAIDITDRKLIEKELIKAKEQAEEGDRLKTAFLANMSHEIRTPMNGIMGFAGLLKEPGLTGSQQQTYIKIIESSGTRMLNLINDIIDISKIEAGLMNLNISDSDINEQIEYIYTFFKPEVDRKGLHFSFKTAFPAKQAIIRTDREKIYAILTNLVKNAIKFTDQGSIEFGYNVKKDVSGSGNEQFSEIEFFVKDTGIGIPKDRQAPIFDRFIQADISDKMALQGAGLGLSISKAYVEMLGGKIRVESEEGKGSVFYFTIPYITKAEMQNFATDAITANDILNHLKGLKILIADDEAASELLLSNIMTGISSKIIKARTGLEVIEACRNNPDLDLILMDIRMPVMDGYKATRQIRQFNHSIIIIAQTAYGLSDDRGKAISAGCNDYISKPIYKEELLTVIKKHFAKAEVSSKD
jgi:PAS domain S-box-containing protein